jgi:hypothetical protein
MVTKWSWIWGRRLHDRGLSDKLIRWPWRETDSFSPRSQTSSAHLRRRPLSLQGSSQEKVQLRWRKSLMYRISISIYSQELMWPSPGQEKMWKGTLGSHFILWQQLPTKISLYLPLRRRGPSRTESLSKVSRIPLPRNQATSLRSLKSLMLHKIRKCW